MTATAPYNVPAANSAAELEARYTESANVARWYATYTCANHEKRVAEQLCGHDVETFLPLYESRRQWKDRRINLQLPLFPGYVFVRMALRNRLCVQRVRGVVHLIGFNGTPAPLEDKEIESLRTSLTQGLRAQPCPYVSPDFSVGNRVRIISGSLKGLDAIVMQKRGARQIIISLDLIQRSVRVTIDDDMIETIAGCSSTL